MPGLKTGFVFGGQLRILQLIGAQETHMKKIIAAAAGLAMVSTILYAGGPLVVADDLVVVEEKPATSSGALVPLLILAVIGIAIAAGNDDAPQDCVLPN